MHPWNCCRMCLGVQNLNPIHAMPEFDEKYATVVFITTGIKINSKDCLPQQMCTPCINFINESYKFRKKCEESQKILHSQLSEKDIYNIKLESMFKEEAATAIDISDLLSIDSNCKAYNDAMDSSNDYVEKVEDINKEEESFKSSIQALEKPLEVIFESENGKADKAVRKRVKKREKVDVKEKVREEIECEYCHKILTSKLSLRNHYKIHTGFDVVCEHCGKKFITRRLLLMHCRAKHGYEKIDKCSYCDYRASNAEQVKIHERLHTGEKPYVCKDCSAGFHRKSSYLQHISIHLPEKTVECDQCPARFKSVTLMRIHKSRHRAPQYTFRCRVCDNSFARRRNVARHLTRIHGLQPADEHFDRLKIS